MKGQHPSGRPIRRENRRSYAMGPFYRLEYVVPRLNERAVERLPSAIGFITHGPADEMWWETRARRGGNK